MIIGKESYACPLADVSFVFIVLVTNSSCSYHQVVVAVNIVLYCMYSIYVCWDIV